MPGARPAGLNAAPSAPGPRALARARLIPFLFVLYVVSYLDRVTVGLAEAGFFPGVIHFLTHWFPAPERARAVAAFMTATALAGVVGGPLSGALLAMDGMAGLAGWQRLFVLGGLPAVLLGGVVLARLPDGPADASWLAPDERAWLLARLAADREAQAAGTGHSVRDAFARGPVWRLAASTSGSSSASTGSRSGCRRS